MDYNKNDMLRESVIPALLGNSAAARFMAFRIYLRYGIISYICADRPRLFDRIDPFSKFFPLHSASEEGVMLEVLDYLARDREYLPVIIPCGEYFENFVEKNREFLEARFIIADRESFFTKKPMSILKEGASYEN